MNCKTLPLTFLVLICFCLSAVAQLHGTVIEKGTRLPVAFATVIYEKDKKQKFENSDVHGYFTLNEYIALHSVTVSCVGYKRKTFTVDTQQEQNLILEIEKDTIAIGDVVVTKENNPAIRIIRNALKNKKQNNFENINQFAYTCYFKTLLDLKRADNVALYDSIQYKKTVSKMAMLVSEVVANKIKVGINEQTTIIAARTSGFNGTLLAQSFFEGFHHSLSFYTNSVPLFKEKTDNKMLNEYLNPLSDDCLNAYRYYLEDSYIQTNDSVFVISFYPKRGSTFNSLRGKMQINSNGFAIQSIVVEPTEIGLINFRFKQDYTYTDGHWFPSKFEEEIGFVDKKLPGLNAYLVYLISARIESVNYQPKWQDSNTEIVAVNIDKHSVAHSDSVLSVWRKDTLTQRELITYHVIDSLGHKHHFDTFLNTFAQLATQCLSVGVFDIDISQLFSYNKYEGNRIGLGLYTNDKLSTWFAVGGYMGYGSKDKQTKYGGSFVFNFNRTNEVKLKLSYQNDLKETGVELINDYKELTANEYLRKYIGYRFDKIKEENATFSFKFLRYAIFSTSLVIRELQPTYVYLFANKLLPFYRADELRFNIRYAYGESYSKINDVRYKTYKGNPIISISYRRGINWLDASSFQYNRFESYIEYTAYRGRIGQSDIRLEGGLIDKALPVGLLFTGEGSKNNQQLFSIRNTFQTMKPYEFLSDKYASLFYQHNFGNLLFSNKLFKPQFVVVHNMGIGALSKSNAQQSIDYKVKDKPYLESGLVINDLLRYKCLNMIYLGAGVGCFYRYGYYALNQPINNTAIKLTITVSFK